MWLRNSPVMLQQVNHLRQRVLSCLQLLKNSALHRFQIMRLFVVFGLGLFTLEPNQHLANLHGPNPLRLARVSVCLNLLGQLLLGLGQESLNLGVPLHWAFFERVH
uniref:Uncharacterized protein n=1 Tax=Lotharella oceanica TaxID=641309 RepID=A0A7S2X7K0_9EUKA